MYIKPQGSNELLASSGLNDRLAMPGANDQQQGPQSKLLDEPCCVEAEINVGGLTLGNSFALIIAGLMLLICGQPMTPVIHRFLRGTVHFSYVIRAVKMSRNAPHFELYRQKKVQKVNFV